MFCSYCGTDNPDDGHFCISCRLDLTAQRTPAARTPARDGELHDSLDGRETVRPPRPGGEVALPEGHLIAGRWRVKGFLGRGGMGEVYRVFDETTQRERALKRIHPGLTRSASARQRFLEEAALSQELVHRHVVRTFDVASAGDRLLFTMELVEGGSLREELDRLAAAGERMPVARALEIADQILAALEYAHRFTIHRDVKPENVLLTSKGAVKLADFGIAKMVDPDRLASMTRALGTPYYMAPEQLRESASVDARADLYAAGALLYELTTGDLAAGHFPWPSEVRDDVPPALDAVLRRALSPVPASRHSSAASMRTELETIGRAVAAARERALRGRAHEARQGWREPRRLIVGSILLGVVGLVLLGWLSVMTGTGARRRITLGRSVESTPRAARSDASAVLASAVPDGMVLVPAGPFVMGSDLGSADERPAHEVLLDAFFIDRTEITVGDFRKCVIAGACGAEAADGGCNLGATGVDDHPMNCVSWSMARDYCHWVGKRLPTEAEWEKAARGTDGRTYPWGAARPSCEHAVMGEQGEGCGREATWPVGSKPSGASPFGVLDMAGNVWEWTQDWYAKRYDALGLTANPMGPTTGPARVLRGGGWRSTAWVLRSSNRSSRLAPTYREEEVGFRCARGP